MNDVVKDFGDYEKTFYIVTTHNGSVYECWPNAGTMHVVSEKENGRIIEASEVSSFIKKEIE